MPSWNALNFSGRVIMPATLRPLGFLILAAVTTFGVSGCIFPFTRGSDAKLDRTMLGEAQAAAEAPKPQAEPGGKKKLPPFAQFLGEMFSGEEHVEPAAATQVIDTEEVAASPAEAPVASKPAQTGPSPAATPPKATSQEPLPVVVSPVEVASNETASHETPSAPSAERPEPEPTIASEQLDEYTKSPWGPSQSLLQQAKRNSAENSTTLTHSLELALQNFHRDNSGQPAVSPQDDAENEVTVESGVAEAQPEEPRGDSAENPLRVAQGKTDWSSRSMRGSTAPQTILNATAESYPQTASKPLKWAADEAEGASQSPSEAKNAPASAPQITVNPYADAPKSEKRPASTANPQIVQNPMASPAVGAENTKNSTDAIHFQSSLLGKLQAANQQAAWDFTKPGSSATDESDEGDLTVVAATTNSLPQIVEPAAETVEPTEQSLVSTPESADEAVALPIEPFVIADPRRPTVLPRGTVVRPAAPTPQIVESPHVPAASSGPPKLPPVVRASEYQGPATANSSRGTKIYVIESRSP